MAMKTANVNNECGFRAGHTLSAELATFILLANLNGFKLGIIVNIVE